MLLEIILERSNAAETVAVSIIAGPAVLTGASIVDPSVLVAYMIVD
jgi:hypothetical protein